MSAVRDDTKAEDTQCERCEEADATHQLILADLVGVILDKQFICGACAVNAEMQPGKLQ